MKPSGILKENIWIIVISQLRFSLMDISLAGFCGYASDKLVFAFSPHV
jgi:hypothetical protein